MELVGGVTLLLDFNLLLLSQKKKKKEEVSKLSNSSDSDGLLLGATNDSRTVEDLTDADGRACSSASADSIAVAENRRPSTVTVLQTWTCPCQGKIIVFRVDFLLCVCCFLFIYIRPINQRALFDVNIFRITNDPVLVFFYRLHFVPFLNHSISFPNGNGAPNFPFY